MSAWMLFAAAVGALASVAALAAERALRLHRLPTRWPWAMAMAATLVLPFVLPAPASPPAVVRGMGMEMAPAAAPRVVPAAAPRPSATMGMWVDAALPWAWGCASVAAAAALLIAAMRLARRRRGWTDGTVAGERVLLSDGVGPAVIGFVRPRIVLPRWALAWAEPLQRLMLRHEREHVRAGDPLLLLGGLLALAAMPWNPALWWQLRRLRLAVEVDCDARTLRGEGDVLAYGRLLLDVGRLGGAPAVPLVAFSEPRSLLEQRITAMTARIPRDRARRALGWTALGALAAVTAAALPVPARPHLPALARPSAAPAVHRAAADTDTARIYTLAEVDAQPALENPEEVRQALQRAYPPQLRAAGVHGIVQVGLVLGANGAVREARLEQTSQGEFNEPALGVARMLRFIPAKKDGRAVPVRFSLPIAFELLAPEMVQKGSPPAPPVHVPVASDEVPLSAVDQPPVITNAGEIAQLLQTSYPALLRDAGVTGSVQVQVVVAPDGTVRSTGVESATHELFAAPAEAAAARMRFRPAMKDGRTVATRLIVPIAFQLATAQP
jgi:TonB family protein